MIEKQIKGRGVTDKKVIDAMKKVKRHLFVPEEMQDLAYRDSPLPIGHEQTISQPYIVAFMTEAAQLTAADRVLEVGTGSGYQAAILGEIAAEVYTVEIIPEHAEAAEKRLEKLGYDNVHVRQGNGYAGWEEQAPFDAIIVTAAPPEIPENLLEQLTIGGKLIVPVGSFAQELKRITRTHTGYETEDLMAVRFVPMVHGDNN